ncbi:hypothetical protein [Endozoicomonas sp.]|uniref:hypothetical protein n=1 Tax=Endozoicomonas sp. TaxID=1892382 RepID=UPI00383A5D84
MNAHKAGSHVTGPVWQTRDTPVAAKPKDRADTTAPLPHRTREKGKTLLHYGQAVRLSTRDARKTDAISLTNQGEQPMPGAVVTAGQHQVSTEDSDLAVILETLQKENSQLKADLDNTKAELFLAHTKKDNINARFDQYKAESEQALKQAVLSERTQNQEESKATLCKLQRKLDTKEEKIKKMELSVQNSHAEKIQLTKQARILQDLKKADEEKIQQLETDLQKIKCHEASQDSNIRALKESLQNDLQAKKINEQNSQLERYEKQLIELKEKFTACRIELSQEKKKSFAERKKHNEFIGDLHKHSASITSRQRKTETKLNALAKPDDKKTEKPSCSGHPLFANPSKDEFLRLFKTKLPTFEAMGFTAPKAADKHPGLQAMLIQMFRDNTSATALIHSIFEDVQRRHSQWDDESMKVLFSQTSTAAMRNIVVVWPGALDGQPCGYLFKPEIKNVCDIINQESMKLTLHFDPFYLAYVTEKRTRRRGIPKPLFFPLEYRPAPSANNIVGKPSE